MSDQYRTTADEPGSTLPPKPAGAPTAHQEYAAAPAPAAQPEYPQASAYPQAPERHQAPEYHQAPDYAPGYYADFSRPAGGAEPPSYGPPPTAPGQAPGTPDPHGPAHRARTGFLRSRLALVTAVAAVAAVLGGLAGGAVADSRHAGTTGAAGRSTGTVVSPVAAKSDGGTDVAAIAAAVSPAVVQLDVSSPGGTATGTGVVLTAGGQILTNFHVISGAVDAGGTITVTYQNGSRTTGTVTGTDKALDVAVITAKGASGLPTAALGDSDQLAVGDPVVAIGNPDGLTGTVTAGIISARNRQVTVQVDEGTTRGNGGFGFPYFPGYGGRPPAGSSSSDTATYSALQTDAALNPGNSGGPLLDAAGQVIGINSAMYTGTGSTAGSTQSGSVGLGFAIPINSIKQVLPKLQAGQTL
ncbi:trypsin-like peptidase domain-containing protein [Kitasatospora sp. LaBMicrA B282]|uniref:S1C family serine protease n=1 Tax=Kitasatospora sp. LaBMicrA B282 TaxID=3420949 RepID=UPI003D09CB97